MVEAGAQQQVVVVVEVEQRSHARTTPSNTHREKPAVSPSERKERHKLLLFRLNATKKLLDSTVVFTVVSKIIN